VLAALGSSRAVMALVVVTMAIVSLDSAAGATDVHSGPKQTTIVLEAPTAYRPKAPPGGGTDDYHCTLLNPHLTHNAFITAIDFQPNSPEVHHEITYAVPPDLAAAAEAQNEGGRGWTCFGESGLDTGAAARALNGGTPWLTAWGPGHNLSKEPAGTGAPMPAGTLVIVQEHYNMLVGDKPVRSKLTLTTVPASTPLRPLRLSIVAAPPDIPCAPGVTGPMCNRPAELASVGQRFGMGQEALVDGLESLCGRNPSDPPVGDTTTCTWPMYASGNIVELAAHMHLLGVGMKFVLNPGKPTQQTLLDVTDYDFHYQRGYVLSKPVPVTPGDTIGITCTYNPQLQEELPILRKVPPHFVTWGDGSTDEMCLGLILMTPPDSVSESAALAHAFSPSV
jgi:Copper type II ascorbate-dependent monooxygenase, C-terminal domain